MKKQTDNKPIFIKNGNGNVLLTTVVGNGNLGGGNVKDVSGNKICKGLLTNFDLGKGDQLIGKSIIVTTNGLDINPQTNDVPVVQSFSGDALDAVVNNFQVVADSDGVVSFVITYNFQKV